MDDLDKLIEDWGDRHSPSPVNDKKKAVSGIVDAIKSQPQTLAEPKRPIMFQLIAAAALLAIGIGIAG